MKQNTFAFVVAGIVIQQYVEAQTIIQNFGSSVNQFSIEFVEIGNPNNSGDTNGNPSDVGSVSYVYNLAKYEVSREMIEKANSSSSINISLSDMSSFGGNSSKKPATGISWYEAAKFVNYLNTTSGYSAAYKFNTSGAFELWSSSDSGYNPNNLFRNSLAKYVIPSVDEWYKGAYGSPTGAWYKYANASNATPGMLTSGLDQNFVVYGLSVLNGPADIDSAGGLSGFGTMAQSGNVWELNETSFDGVNDQVGEQVVLRGGAWYTLDGNDIQLSSQLRGSTSPSNETGDPGYALGFRVAMVPEPSALSLLAVGLGGLAMLRRRRS